MSPFDYVFVLIVLITNYILISRRMAAKASEEELRSDLASKDIQIKTMENIAETMAVVIQNSQMTIDMQNIMVVRLNNELKSKEALLNKIIEEAQARSELDEVNKGQFN